MSNQFRVEVIATSGRAPQDGEIDERDIQLRVFVPNGEIRELWLGADGENRTQAHRKEDLELDTIERQNEVVDSQVRYIEERFGKDVDYNLGWGVDENGIATKVYGHGVVDTDWATGTHKFDGD